MPLSTLLRHKATRRAAVYLLTHKRTRDAIGSAAQAVLAAEPGQRLERAKAGLQDVKGSRLPEAQAAVERLKTQVKDRTLAWMAPKGEAQVFAQDGQWAVRRLDGDVLAHFVEPSLAVAFAALLLAADGGGRLYVQGDDVAETVDVPAELQPADLGCLKRSATSRAR